MDKKPKLKNIGLSSRSRWLNFKIEDIEVVTVNKGKQYERTYKLFKIGEYQFPINPDLCRETKTGKIGIPIQINREYNIYRTNNSVYGADIIDYYYDILGKKDKFEDEIEDIVVDE